MATVTRYPSSHTVVATGWTSPSGAYADDAAYATAAPSKNGSISGDFGGFGLDALIPDGSVINSVTVEVLWKLSTTASIDTLGFQPYVGGVAQGAEFTTTTVTTAETANAQQYTGLTRNDLLDANFKVRARASRANSNTAFTASLDYVRVTVDYTAPAVVDLSGTVSGQAALTGTPEVFSPVTVELSGTVAGSSSVIGTPVSEGMFGGTVSGLATVTGAPHLTRYFSGSIPGQASVTGSPIITKQFSGTVSAAATLTGILEVETPYKNLSGTISGVATLSGSLVVERLFGGLVGGVATLLGNLRKQLNLTGSILGSAELAGSPTVGESAPSSTSSLAIATLGMLAGPRAIALLGFGTLPTDLGIIVIYDVARSSDSVVVTRESVAAVLDAAAGTDSATTVKGLVSDIQDTIQSTDLAVTVIDNQVIVATYNILDVATYTDWVTTIQGTVVAIIDAALSVGAASTSKDNESQVSDSALGVDSAESAYGSVNQVFDTAAATDMVQTILDALIDVQDTGTGVDKADTLLRFGSILSMLQVWDGSSFRKVRFMVYDGTSLK